MALGWLGWPGWFPVTPLHFVWRASLGDIDRVAGVELGDIDLHFVWQAWQLVTSTFSLCAKCGKHGTGLAPVARLVHGDAAPLCVAGVALGDIDLHFVWHARHLVTSTCTLHERRGGTYGTGLALVAHLRHAAGFGGAFGSR